MTDFVLFLAPHMVGFFLKISIHTKWNLFILRSGLILENIRRMFLLSIWATGTMYMNFDEKHFPNVLENRTRLQNSAYTTNTFDEKHFPNVLENRTRLQNSAYTTNVRAWFSAYSALYLNKFHQREIDIFRKILPDAELKHSNTLCAPSHLVTRIPQTD